MQNFISPQSANLVNQNLRETASILTISGHTHGGQVHIPFLGFTILPVKNKKYINGFYRTTNGNLFISRGIGWTIVPVRFNCAPEIAILELVQEELHSIQGEILKFKIIF